MHYTTLVRFTSCGSRVPQRGALTDDSDRLDGREANDSVIRSRPPRARRTVVAETRRKPSVLHRRDWHDRERSARRVGVPTWLGRLRTPYAQAHVLESPAHAPQGVSRHESGTAPSA